MRTASNKRTDRLTDPHLFASFAVYQGLIPWAWIEASTKGAVLLFAAAEIQDVAMTAGVGPAAAGLLGGMGGGVAQAYATVGMSFLSFFGDSDNTVSDDCRPWEYAGFCTCMKTAEITRSKMAVNGQNPPSTCVLGPLQPSSSVPCELTRELFATDGSCLLTCTARAESAGSTRVSTRSRFVR